MICANSTRAAVAALALLTGGFAGCTQSDKSSSSHPHDSKAEKGHDGKAEKAHDGHEAAGDHKAHDDEKDHKDAKHGEAAKPTAKEAAEIAAERAKLSPEDKILVEAQEWCAVTTHERLGAMGPPLKIELDGKPVFLCCKGCRKKAEADPAKTLAQVETLKAEKKAELGSK